MSWKVFLNISNNTVLLMLHLLCRDFEAWEVFSLWVSYLPGFFILALPMFVPGGSRHPLGRTGLGLCIPCLRRKSPGPICFCWDVSLLTAREEIGNDSEQVLLSWKNELGTLLKRVRRHYSLRKRRKGMSEVACHSCLGAGEQCS